MAILVTKSPVRLFASPKAVITRFLNVQEKRVEHVIERVKALGEKDAALVYAQVMQDFSKRHRDIEETFLDHYNYINEHRSEKPLQFSENKKLLLGSIFTMEYSIKSAALFNPSIVIHPDQSGLQPGELKFIMSLRATGEGHISSIVFQTGIVNNIGDILLDKAPDFFTRLKRRTGVLYDKSFFEERVSNSPHFKKELLDNFSAISTIEDVQLKLMSNEDEHPSINGSFELLEEILDSNYELESSAHLPMNGKVIFPLAKRESMGMEDVRFVRFEDNGNACYYGTYTAYNGHEIQTKIIETADFDVFKIRTLHGAAVSDKGMALFPEKVNGKYVMVSRQGGEMINIMFSDDLYTWEDFQLLLEPKCEWELLQLGNCGSPVKTDRGWLLLTHGVGAMRTYVISAILLDLNDPSKVIGRLDKPLIKADESEREGYVPNVVYSCGLIRHGDLLLIPYAVSDSATGFVTVGLNEILNEMNL